MLPSLVITLAALAVNLLSDGVLAGLGKMVASTGFLGMALAAGALRGAFGRILLLGLVCSWCGDLFLIFSGPPYFLLGLAAFLLAHLAYGGAFLAHGVQPHWVGGAALLLVVPVLLVARWLQPHLGDMRFPVYAYIAIISLMVMLAAGAAGKGAPWQVLAGALLFFCSDIFVARGRFVSPGELNGWIGLPLYYAGQLLLASSVRPWGVKSCSAA